VLVEFYGAVIDLQERIYIGVLVFAIFIVAIIEEMAPLDCQIILLMLLLLSSSKFDFFFRLYVVLLQYLLDFFAERIREVMQGTIEWMRQVVLVRVDAFTTWFGLKREATHRIDDRLEEVT
jgi:hypothetical protein